MTAAAMSSQASIRAQQCREPGWGDVPGKERGSSGQAPLISPGEDGLLRGWLSAVYANAGASRLVERNAAHGGAGLFFDLGFAFGTAAPRGKGETGFHRFFQVVVGLGVVGIGFAEGQRFVVHGLLDFG